MASPELKSDVTLQLMAAQIYLSNGRLKEALSLVMNDAENLEKSDMRQKEWSARHSRRVADPAGACFSLLIHGGLSSTVFVGFLRLSMCVLIYLRIDRPDLATKSLKAMQDLDDDDTLTQLATAWVGIASGGADKTLEAAFLLQELLEKFGPSVVVLNSLAVCDIHQRNYTNAFQYTKQARELSIKTGARVTAETLLNSIVCLQHLKRGQDIIEKIEAELKLNYPQHPWIAKQKQMSELFEKHASTFKAKQ